MNIKTTFEDITLIEKTDDSYNDSMIEIIMFEMNVTKKEAKEMLLNKSGKT